MKNFRNLSLVPLFLLGAFILSSCGKSDNNTAPATPTTTYYKSNNLCYDNNNNNVDISNCNSLSYYISNGVCYANDGTIQSGFSNCTNNTFFLNGSTCLNQSGQAQPSTSCTASSTAAQFYISDGTCRNFSHAAVDSSNCTNLTFAIQNKICWNRSTFQPSDLSSCIFTLNYYVSGNTCYDRNQNAVQASLCNSSSGGTPTSYPSESCVGAYQYVNYQGQLRAVTCNGNDCRGEILLKSTGAFVFCL